MKNLFAIQPRLLVIRRTAFTLVELLVVIAIIGILVSLLLPAVQSAREAGRRSQCINNMRQIVLAYHNRHDTLKHFPHGTYNYLDDTGNTPPPYNDTQDRRCWAQDIWPYIEQNGLFERFEKHMSTGASALAFADSYVVIPVFMCPSDSESPKTHTFWGGIGTPTQGFSGNYVTCAGNDYFNRGGKPQSTKLNGVSFAVSKVTMALVTDGTSNTLLASELILSPDTDSHDIRGRYHNPAHGGVLFSTRLTPNNTVADQLNWCGLHPVKRAPCVYTGTDMFVSARSYHPGGVNVSLVDGSTRFMSNNISSTVFLAYGSRNGGEAVSGE